MTDFHASLAPLLDNSALPCIAVDIEEGLILAANHNARALLDVQTLQGERFSNFVPDSLGDLIVFTNAVEHYGQSSTRELALKTEKNEALKVEIHGRMLHQNAQKILVLLFIDIDAYETRTQSEMTSALHAKGLMEWNRAHNFFLEMESQNRLILDAAGEGIYGVDLEGKTTFVNNAAQEILGWTAEDLLGKDIHNMIHHHHLDGKVYPASECPIYHSFRNELVNRIENEVFWNKEGQPIQVEYVSTPIYDQEVLAGAVVIFRDITERRESERKLNAAMAEIEALKTQLEQENEYLKEEILNVQSHYNIIGSSPAVLRTLAQVDLVAPTNSNVLITGEGGTGKTLVASAIHQASPRAKRPIVKINCAGISSERFDSELYGHIRGAFQGAVYDRTGKLEIASGGTLFLDEVSEIPFHLQGKVLKTLQEQSLERLGENRLNKIDVRVIASSTKDLTECIKQGTFREDLYFHLNVFPIQCHPLRERITDIPELTQHFLSLTCKELNLEIPHLTKANINQLSDYHWPGNVRELQNVIERGAILSRGEKLILNLQKTQKTTDSEHKDVLTEDQLNDLQKRNIIACLKVTNGKVSGKAGAAEMLGIRPTTLYSRIKKLKIDVK